MLPPLSANKSCCLLWNENLKLPVGFSLEISSVSTEVFFGQKNEVWVWETVGLTGSMAYSQFSRPTGHESSGGYYNPYNQYGKRPSSGALVSAAKQMSQVEAAVAYIKNQNINVNRTTLPSFSDVGSSSVARQLLVAPKPLFTLKDTARSASDRMDTSLSRNSMPERTLSSRKSVRFSSDLEVHQTVVHAPQDPSSLPLVSVLKTSGKLDINPNPTTNSLLKPRAATASTTNPSRAAGARTEPSVDSNYQISGELLGGSQLPQTQPPTQNQNANTNIPPRSSNAGSGALVPANSVRPKVVRPSLSEQLASIGANAAALTQDIRAKAGLDKGGNVGDPPLLTFPARGFTVGTLSCRYPSPISFYQDRMEYVFHHPFENTEIRMVMYYRDIIGPVVVGNKLRYKLPRALTHFPSDFDPNNPQHQITVEFTSNGAASSVKQRVFPLMTPSLGLGARWRRTWLLYSLFCWDSLCW